MENENVTASSLGEDLGINPHLFMYYVTQTMAYRSGILLGLYMYVLPSIFVLPM